MRRTWLGVVALVAVLGIAVAVAAFSRGSDAHPKRQVPSLGSQRAGDDADLMRRLQRKRLVGQKR